MSHYLRHSLTLLRREVSQPELRLVFFALCIAVTAIASVGLFADRISRTLVNQSNELLGADEVVYSMREIPAAWREQAATIGLRTSINKEFYSVLVSGSETILAEIKAVDTSYPLRGAIKVRLQQAADLRIPAIGTVWLAPRLLQKLNLQLGDEVQLGRRSFKVGGIIEHEPDRAGSLFSLAPRLMMNHADLPATGLIGPGSRVRHRLLVAGQAEEIQQFEDWINPLLDVNYRLITVRDSRPEVRASLERAEHFLSLTLIVTLVLSCITIWVAMQTWVKRRMIYAAVLKTIGLTRNQILKLFLGQLLLLSLIACTLAAIFALVIQEALVNIMRSFITGELQPASLWIVLAASAMGLLLVLAFSLPGYFRFASTPPNLVLRSIPDKLETTRSPLILGVIVLAAVLAVLVRDTTLLLMTIGSLLAAILLLVLLSLLLLRALRHVPAMLPVGIKMGVNALLRHRQETLTMMVVFGLSFIFITLLTLVRTDLIDQWRDRLPTGTPNTFVVNISAQDRQAVKQWLLQNGFNDVDVYPMIKGRLIEINGKKIHGDSYASERTRRLIQREFNLSWSDTLPTHNKLKEGQWWQAGQLPQWSVETGIAERLEVSIGDTLTYDITGKKITGVVSNIREVSWDSFKVNFFVLGQASMLDGFPKKYISSFYLPPDKQPLISDLVARFPSLTVLDTDAIMERIRSVVDKVSIAAEAAFVFTLIAAVILVMGMINAGRKMRQQESALLRSMGASNRILLTAQLTEFIILGLSSGLLAILAANGMAWYVATELLDFDFAFNFGLAAKIMLAGMLLSVATGWLVLRSQQHQSPMLLLRKSV